MIILRSLLTLLLHTSSWESPIFHSCSGVRLTTSPDVFQVSRDSSCCLLWCLLWLRTQVCLSFMKNSKSSFCTVSRVNVLIISCNGQCNENATATFYLPDPTASVNDRLEMKEKHEELLRTTVGSTVWNVATSTLRGLVGLIIVRPFLKDFVPFLVAAGFTTIMACCGHSMPSLLHWSRYVRCKEIRRDYSGARLY